MTEEEDQWKAHLREHTLMSDNHKKDHEHLADIMKETADRLDSTLRATASTLADTVRVQWENHMTQHQQSDRAVDKAEAEMEKQLGSMAETVKQNKTDANEWRGSMKDRETLFATKADWQSNAKDIVELQRWRSASEGKTQGMQPMVAIGLTVLTAVIVAVVVAFVTKGGLP